MEYPAVGPYHLNDLTRNDLRFIYDAYRWGANNRPDKGDLYQHVFGANSPDINEAINTGELVRVGTVDRLRISAPCPVKPSNPGLEHYVCAVLGTDPGKLTSPVAVPGSRTR